MIGGDPLDKLSLNVFWEILLSSHCFSLLKCFQCIIHYENWHFLLSVSEWSGSTCLTSSTSWHWGTRGSSRGTCRTGGTCPRYSTAILHTLTPRGERPNFVVRKSMFQFQGWRWPESNLHQHGARSPGEAGVSLLLSQVQSVVESHFNICCQVQCVSLVSLHHIMLGTGTTCWWTRCGLRRGTPPPLTSALRASCHRTATPRGCGSRCVLSVLIQPIHLSWTY